MAELMSTRKELTETRAELRKVLNERNALRIRLAHAEHSARELASAFRAEAELRAEFVDAHSASSAALRARVSELEAALALATRAPKPEEQPGLRQIRGIGPAFEPFVCFIGRAASSRKSRVVAGRLDIAAATRVRADGQHVAPIDVVVVR